MADGGFQRGIGGGELTSPPMTRRPSWRPSAPLLPELPNLSKAEAALLDERLQR
jgi:hypothetical protein